MFTSGNIKAQAVPDCLVRLLARKMEERGWQYIFAKGEGDATPVDGFGIFHFGIITSEDVDARFLVSLVMATEAAPLPQQQGAEAQGPKESVLAPAPSRTRMGI